MGEAVIGYDGEFFEHQTLFAVYGEAAPDTLEIDYVQIREGVHLSIGVRVSNPETVIPKVGQLLFVAVPTQYLEGIIRYGAYVSSVE